MQRKNVLGNIQFVMPWSDWLVWSMEMDPGCRYFWFLGCYERIDLMARICLARCTKSCLGWDSVQKGRENLKINSIYYALSPGTKATIRPYQETSLTGCEMIFLRENSLPHWTLLPQSILVFTIRSSDLHLKDLESQILPSLSTAITLSHLPSLPLISLPENSNKSTENWGTLNPLVTSSLPPHPLAIAIWCLDYEKQGPDQLALTCTFRDAYLIYTANTVFQPPRKSFLVSKGYCLIMNSMISSKWCLQFRIYNRSTYKTARRPQANPPKCESWLPRNWAREVRCCKGTLTCLLSLGCIITRTKYCQIAYIWFSYSKTWCDLNPRLCLLLNGVLELQ